MNLPRGILFREYAREFYVLATVANNTGKELATDKKY